MNYLSPIHLREGFSAEKQLQYAKIFRESADAYLVSDLLNKMVDHYFHKKDPIQGD